MKKQIYNQFSTLRDSQDSIIILGLDPKNDEQREKVIELSHIKRNILGFKPNLAFYQDDGGRERLKQIADNSGSHMIRLLDLKSPDGAATNFAALKEYAPYFEYVTIAPAGGCIEETIQKASSLNQETFSMGAMSFPGVLREINLGLPLFKQRVDRAIDAGTAGFVLGATAYVRENCFDEEMNKYRTLKSDKPILEEEMNNDNLRQALKNRNELFSYIVDRMNKNSYLLALIPGFGRQGGKLENFLESGIDLNRCLINAGSDVLKADVSMDAIVDMNNIFNTYRRKD